MTTPTSPPDIVYAIESTHRYEDADRRDRTDSTILDEEGWFATEKAAQDRADQLNTGLRQAHAADEDRQRRTVDKKRREAQQYNREAAAIRAAGMRKADIKVPDPYAGRDFETWARHQHSLTTHHVVTLERSEHDLREAGSTS